MPVLIITVNCRDASDLDWLRVRAIASIENVVETAREKGRLDDEVKVSWDIDDIPLS